MRIPLLGWIITSGSSSDRKSIEELRQNVQLHPEEAQVHFDLGWELLLENNRQIRMHEMFKEEWTQEQAREWWEREEETIRELREAISSFHSGAKLLSQPDMAQKCARAHFWLADKLEIDQPAQARIEWEHCLQLATGELAKSARWRLRRLDRDKNMLLRASRDPGKSSTGGTELLRAAPSVPSSIPPDQHLRPSEPPNENVENSFFFEK